MAEEERGGPARGIGQTFTRKLGPLPAWAWIGIGAGVGLLWLSMRRKASVQGTQGATDLKYGAAPGGGGLLGTGLGAGGFVDGGGGSGSSPVNPPPVTVGVPPPPPTGTGGTPNSPQLFPINLGGQFLNWSQAGLDQFLHDIQAPNVPWEDMGYVNGVRTFRPKNTMQPLPAGASGNRVPLDFGGHPGGSGTQASVAGNLVPQSFGGAVVNPPSGAYISGNPAGGVPGGYAYRFVNGALQYVRV